MVAVREQLHVRGYVSQAARSPLFTDDSRAPAGLFPSENQSPGREFLDAETSGQESNRDLNPFSENSFVTD
jgi:hypothetical protein